MKKRVRSQPSALRSRAGAVPFISMSALGRKADQGKASGRLPLMTPNGHRGNPSASSVLCESVRYLSKHDTGREFRIYRRCGRLAIQWDEAVRLLALRLASQGSQKFFGREGFDQDRDPLRRNRIHRLRSGVAGHHCGGYTPAKGGAQAPDGLDTIR